MSDEIPESDSTLVAIHNDALADGVELPSIETGKGIPAGKNPPLTLLTRAFWGYSFERMVKSASYTGLGLITSKSAGLMSFDWAGFGSAVAMAAITSILVSLSSFKNL